ncbi:SDR family oxidoreductase [Alcaligenaceae bacterium]|nr:SDR family oxidoreductase [Alcaligenaceae bacterium]
MSDARTVLVTGARRGIGYTIAERLFHQGCNVVLVDVDAEDVERAAAKLDPSGVRVLPATADVSRSAEISSVLKRVEDKFGGIDILVNNAGISPKHDGKKAFVLDMDETEWRHVLDINLTSAFLCVQACLPWMKKRNWGRIINMSSQAGRTVSTIAGAHYAASKAGMIAFSRTLAAEIGADGITSNCVAPGRIVTPMAEEAGADANAAYLQRIPVHRLGNPEDIAGVVAFLASDDASFITGATIDVNGGAFMG